LLDEIEKMLAAHQQMIAAMLGPKSMEWPTGYPFGQCLSSSLLLIPSLRAFQPNEHFSVCLGYVIDIDVLTGDPKKKTHAWIRWAHSMGEVGIDPTLGQFDKFDDDWEKPGWIVSWSEYKDTYEPWYRLSYQEESDLRQQVVVYRWEDHANLRIGQGRDNIGADLLKARVGQPRLGEEL
jgi:hypothetical protein